MRIEHVRHQRTSRAFDALFADAEIPKDHVENILDIDATKKLAQSARRQPQLLRHDLFSVILRGLLRTPQCNYRFREMGALPRARHQGWLRRKEPLSELGKRVNQLINA